MTDMTLLTTRQVAEFVANGMLTFPGVISDELNARALSEMKGRVGGEPPYPTPETLTPLSGCYLEPSALGEVLRHPTVSGIIRSLLGPESVFDHDFTHFIQAGTTRGQTLHVDALQDSLDPAFDVQIFYFPLDVEPGAGGTRFVPGTHLRQVNASGVGRYQHIKGERFYSGPAGTIVVAHQGLWHAGQPNPASDDRWMHKFRFNPTVPQVKQWDLAGFDEVHNDASDHMFAHMRTDSVGAILRMWHPWLTVGAHRQETVQRVKLWRYLTGDDTFDVDYYVTRIEQRDRLGEMS